MKKLAKRSVLMDRLHKGFVVTCMGATIISAVYLVFGAYNYFAVYKPVAKQRQILEKQQLLAEGSSDNLKDTAATLQL